MFKRLALVSTLNLALLATGAMAEPWVKKYDPPAAYSIDKPAYAYFKEITVTRRSSRDLDFDITLQGPIPKNMPKDYGLDYYVYSISRTMNPTLPNAKPAISSRITGWRFIWSQMPPIRKTSRPTSEIFSTAPSFGHST